MDEVTQVGTDNKHCSPDPDIVGFLWGCYSHPNFYGDCDEGAKPYTQSNRYTIANPYKYINAGFLQLGSMAGKDSGAFR